MTERERNALQKVWCDIQRATSELEERLPIAKAALQSISPPVSYSMLRNLMAGSVNLPETEAELQKVLQKMNGDIRAAAAALQKLGLKP